MGGGVVEISDLLHRFPSTLSTTQVSSKFLLKLETDTSTVWLVILNRSVPHFENPTTWRQTSKISWCSVILALVHWTTRILMLFFSLCFVCYPFDLRFICFCEYAFPSCIRAMPSTVFWLAIDLFYWTLR